jgi:hypothetical protein
MTRTPAGAIPPGSFVVRPTKPSPPQSVGPSPFDEDMWAWLIHDPTLLFRPMGGQLPLFRPRRGAGNKPQ